MAELRGGWVMQLFGEYREVTEIVSLHIDVDSCFYEF
jgi:hypothetical protein